MEIPFYKEIVKCLASLPDERARAYEKEIAKLSNQCSNQDYLEALEAILEEGNSLSFAAFYTICTYYRRIKDYEQLNTMILKHQEFKNKISFNHIYIQYMVNSESFYDYDELLELAYYDAKKLYDNAGFLHTFCNTFATICEQCNKQDQSNIISKWFKKVEKCINHAIELDPEYAKFYSTKARILSLKGRYQEAYYLINQAIAKENSRRNDYALTIANYQYYKLMFIMNQHNKEKDEEISRLKDTINKLTNDMSQNAYPISNSYVQCQALKKINIYEDTDEPYAFISYAHKDADDIYEALEYIQNNDTNIWFDKGIKPGEDWAETIAEKISNCNAVLLFLSWNSINSNNVRREINSALSMNKTIIAVILDSVELTPGMSMQLGLCQMVNKLEHSEEEFYKIICQSLNKELK